MMSQEGFKKSEKDRLERNDTEKQETVAILDKLSRDLENMSESFHNLLVRSALINVELGLLFDPDAVEILKESEAGCFRCSQKTTEMMDKPFGALEAKEDRK